MEPNELEGKIAGSASGVSSILSFLGGYNVCHSVCLGILAALAIIGISLQGMPLAFLQDYATPLWALAVALLLATAYLYTKHACISRELLAANTGLIIAATPFTEIDQYRPLFWLLGFGIAGVAAYNHFSGRKEEKKCPHTPMQQ